MRPNIAPNGNSAIPTVAENRPARGLGQVLALIREDFATHNREWSSPGFRAVAVYRLNAWRLTIPSRPLRLPLTLICRAAYRWVRNRYGIELPATAKVGRRFQIVHWGGVVIHRYAEIGDDCTIRHGATLGATSEVTRDSGPKVGNQVKIGAGAMVIGAVTIGDRAKVGPNAVVTMDVPADATAFANPARTIYAPNAEDGPDG